MAVTVWSNHTLRPRAGALLEQYLGDLGCTLVRSDRSSSSVLTQGAPDPGIAQADVVYGQPDPADVMAHARIRWVALSSAGYTRYAGDAFRSAMRARGTIVTSASGVFANPCAEHALAMLLTLARELPREILNGAGERAWNYAEGRYTLATLTGSTVLILGHGSIGRRLAELLSPFRARVIGIRRSPSPEPHAEILPFSSLPGVLGLADHVVNCLPEAPSTRRLCDAAFFARMKCGARFCNIGRGSTVDQEALADALDGGRIGGAFLDALDPEPLPPDHRLWRTARCHITPHLAGGHLEQDENLVRHFRANLERLLSGTPLVDRVI